MKNQIDLVLETTMVKNEIPNSLLTLFLAFFREEDHDEIMEFIEEKLKITNLTIPLNIFAMMELLCEDLLDEIVGLEEHINNINNNLSEYNIN